MTTIKDKNGFKEIQFLDRGRKRRSLYPGKINKRQAEAIVRRGEGIVSLQIQGLSIDTELSQWLSDQEESFHVKLAKLGLCKRRPKKSDLPTLKAWTDRYINGHNVPAEWIDKLIHETKDESWKIILALARYGGLRPHECLIQKWEDVDLIQNPIGEDASDPRLSGLPRTATAPNAGERNGRGRGEDASESSGDAANAAVG